jgi:hypothetical protein
MRQMLWLPGSKLPDRKDSLVATRNNVVTFEVLASTKRIVNGTYHPATT